MVSSMTTAPELLGAWNVALAAAYHGCHGQRWASPGSLRQPKRSNMVSKECKYRDYL